MNIANKFPKIYVFGEISFFGKMHFLPQKGNCSKNYELFYNVYIKNLVFDNWGWGTVYTLPTSWPQKWAKDEVEGLLRLPTSWK